MVMDFSDKVIDAIQLGGAALVKFEKAAEDVAARDQRIAAQIPGTVEALQRAGMIDATEKEACARALADPEQAVALLKQAAQFVLAQAAAAPGTGGRPVDAKGNSTSRDKQASTRTGGGYVGRRGAPSDAWDGFGRALGLTN